MHNQQLIMRKIFIELLLLNLFQFVEWKSLLMRDNYIYIIIYLLFQWQLYVMLIENVIY